MMSTPDRDAISAARVFKYHVVANGSPGTVLDSTGRQVRDNPIKLSTEGIFPIKLSQLTLSSGRAQVEDFHAITHNTTVDGASIGTIDLDATWVHENLPGAQQVRTPIKLSTRCPDKTIS